MSLVAWDLDTKLTIKRPCSERASFTVRRNDPSTKSAAGQVIPELCTKKAEQINYRTTQVHKN